VEIFLRVTPQKLFLQDKVRELRSKLAQQPGGDSDSVAGGSGRPSTLFDQHRDTLESLEDKRRREGDRVGAELAQTKEELARLKLKYDGVVSRKSILEGEVSFIQEISVCSGWLRVWLVGAPGVGDFARRPRGWIFRQGDDTCPHALQRSSFSKI
jgi:hypothetical protein